LYSKPDGFQPRAVSLDVLLFHMQVQGLGDLGIGLVLHRRQHKGQAQRLGQGGDSALHLRLHLARFGLRLGQRRRVGAFCEHPVRPSFLYPQRAIG